MSKNYKLQLKNTSGEVLEESNLVVKEGDTILMNYDTDKFTIQQAKEIFDTIKYSLENDVNFIGIPSGIKLQILSKR